jgi:lipoprotein LprG
MAHRPIPRLLALGVSVALVLMAAACGGGSDSDDESLLDDPSEILAASAQAMGEIETVRFEIDHDGDPVHIDPGDSLEFDEAIGQFQAPRSAQAVLTVIVGGSLRTELGAIAIDDEAWLQTPLTDYAPLPPEYGIDPALFFDPKGGWRPLLAELGDAELVAVENRNGERSYHIRGTASAERIEIVTARLVDEPVEFDVWIGTDTALVVEAAFSADVSSGVADWVITLSEYGDEVSIEPPDVG